MDLGLTKRTALVTGASSGLGLACAQALAAEGVEVVLASRSPERLERAVATITKSTAGSAAGLAAGSTDGTAAGSASWIEADVSDPDAALALVEAATERLGHLDILICNAGGPPAGDFASTDLSAYEPALRLNLLSTVALCTAAVPAMQAQKWGRIVAVTSITVREPNPRLILSNTARAGVTGFLKTLAREVAGDGVTVNSIQPGLHATDRLQSIYGDEIEQVMARTPSGKLGDPADFGQVAAFLCSEAANYVTGAAIPVDGGEAHSLQ